MLINTLYLFLREVLPVFLLSSMLSSIALPAAVRVRIVLGGLCAGMVLYLFSLLLLDWLSEALDGAGLEMFFLSSAAVQMLLFASSVLLLNYAIPGLVPIFLGLMLALLTMSSLINFLTFFTAQWTQHSFCQPLILGAVIGAGLSTSLGILLYFGLYCIRRCLPLTPLVLLALFVSGHMANALNLLAQIGWVESEVLWSTHGWLSDQYTFAQILSSFFGYEDSPIAWHVYGYLICLGALLTIIASRRKALAGVLALSEDQRT